MCSNHDNGSTGIGVGITTMLELGLASKVTMTKLHSNEALCQKLFCRFLPQAGDYAVQASLGPP